MPLRNPRRSFKNLKIADLKNTPDLYNQTISKLEFKVLKNIGNHLAGTVLSCHGGLVSGVGGKRFTDREWFAPMLPMNIIHKLRAAGHDVKTINDGVPMLTSYKITRPYIRR
jgi:hypothetical protein